MVSQHALPAHALITLGLFLICGKGVHSSLHPVTSTSLRAYHICETTFVNMAKAGSQLPEIELQEGAPDKSVKITDLFKGKKGILFGVPGAFTPGCAKTHLPGYITDYDKLTKAGAQVIVCVAVNDAFVMTAWGESAGAKGKVHMLADSHGELARALGVELDMSKMLGTKRMKRFSAVIDNNVIKTLNVEPDGAGLTCSLSNEIIGQLQQA